MGSSSHCFLRCDQHFPLPLLLASSAMLALVGCRSSPEGSSQPTDGGGDPTAPTGGDTVQPADAYNPLPVLVTAPATDVGATGAVLYAVVNPRETSTTVEFQWGTTTTYGATGYAEQSPFAGSGDQVATLALSGLMPATTYHFNARAQNAAGMVEGTDQVFTTLSAPADPFAIVILPDTQHYTSATFGTPAMFTSQTQWIVDNRDALNIALVLHEGDLTNDNSTQAFDNAKTSLSLLDGVVPYVLAVGNHDGIPSATPDTTNFNNAFPVSSFSALPTFGGVFEAAKMDNSYHFIAAGGRDWLILSLEFGPRDVVLEWAKRLIETHPLHRVIVVTHAHIYPDNTLHGSVDSHLYRPVEDYGRENNGDDVWRDLLRRYANVAFVFNGHLLDDGQGRLVSIGDNGNRVFQMLCNFQTWSNGGDGFLRVLELFPAEDAFFAWTYSPFLDLYRTGPEVQFEYHALDILRDLSRPTLVSVSALGRTLVQVHFSEPVALASAADLESYRVDAGLVPEAATLLSDLQTVVLTTPTLDDGSHTVAVSNVQDRGSPANTIAPDSGMSFTVSGLALRAEFDSTDLSGWTVVDEGDTDGPSDWQIAGGALVQSSNIYGPHSANVDQRKGTFAYWYDPGSRFWKDYTLRVTLRSADDDGIGVIFRYQDPGNCYKLDLDRQRGFRKLFKMVSGVETEIASVAAGYAADTDMVVEVSVHGSQIDALLDGVEIFGTAVTDASLSSGTVALYSWGNAGSYFDNVEVELVSVSEN